MTAAVASATTVDGAVNGNSATLTPPSGMTTGDLDVIACIFGNGLGSSFGTPAGYTNLFNDAVDNDGDGANARIAAWYRSAEASPSNAVITWDSYARKYTAARFRLTGVLLADPVNVVGSASEGADAPSTNPTMTIGAATTTAANCLALALFGWKIAALSVTPFFAASGWTAAGWSNISFFDGNAPSACAFSKVIAGAGSTGSCVVDPSAESYSTARAWLGRIVAFNSAPTIGRSMAMVI